MEGVRVDDSSFAKTKRRTDEMNTKPFNLTCGNFVLFLFAIGGHLCAQPVPHHFNGLVVLPDQSVTLSLEGSVSNLFNLTGTISNQFKQMFDLYVVEASTNLLDWTGLALLLRTNNNSNPLLFQDTNAADFGLRLYRTLTNHLLTAFPKPTGPFAVGTIDRVMMDPTRTNLYRYSPPTNAFMVTFWYPADPPAPGVLPAALWNKRFAADPGFIELIKSFGATYADVRWASPTWLDIILITCRWKPALPDILWSSIPMASRRLANGHRSWRGSWRATGMSCWHPITPIAGRRNFQTAGIWLAATWT